MHATASRGLGECAKWVPHFNFTRFEGGGGGLLYGLSKIYEVMFIILFLL